MLMDHDGMASSIKVGSVALSVVETTGHVAIYRWLRGILSTAIDWQLTYGPPDTRFRKKIRNEND